MPEHRYMIAPEEVPAPVASARIDAAQAAFEEDGTVTKAACAAVEAIMVEWPVLNTVVAARPEVGAWLLAAAAVAAHQALTEPAEVDA